MELARLGADLLLVARDAHALDDMAGTVSAEAPRCRVRTVSADLSTEAGRARVIEAVPESEGLHILVNNVGTNIRKRMEQISLEEYRRVQETNLVSCFEMCRRLLPALKAAAPSSPAGPAAAAADPAAFSCFSCVPFFAFFARFFPSAASFSSLAGWMVPPIVSPLTNIE